MKAILSFIILSLLAGVAQATPYGTITANELMSMDLSKTWLFPAGSDTLAGLTSAQTLSNKTLQGSIFDVLQGVQQTTPSIPPPLSNKLYFKSDNNLYALDSAGTEYQINGGGGGGGSVTAVSASAPLSVTNPTSTPNISIPQATTSVDGFLAHSDWNTFNSKQNAIAPGTYIVPAGTYPFTGNQSMGGHLINFLATPLVGTDAANKAYVDSSVPGVFSMVQESPAGSCNGSNVTFTTSATPEASNGVILFEDGSALAQGGGLDYVVSGNTLTLGAPCVPGQYLWVVYNGTLASIPAWNIESHTLTSTDITNQYITLVFAANPNSLMMSVEGLGQQTIVDYNLSIVGGVTRISFAGNLATSGLTPLIAGNILYVQYQH
jgi:hypothetical protein